MKLHEQWQQKLAKENIQFRWTILKGKFPHEAVLTFQDGYEISMRGRRIGNEYHLLASQVREERIYQEKLPYFSHLLSFFKEFLQGKEEVNTLLIRAQPFGDNYTVIEEQKLIYFSELTSENLKNQGYLQHDYPVYYVPYKDNAIEKMNAILRNIDEWGRKKEEEYDLFHVKNYTTITSPQLNYHYAGHNGSLKFELGQEEHIISEKELEFDCKTTLGEMEKVLEIFFEKLVKKQKLRLMFMKETYYLDHYLYRFSFYGLMSQRIKSYLIEKLPIQEIEIRAARCIKKKEKGKSQSISESQVQLVNIIGFHLVIDNHEIIFSSESMEEAVLFYKNLLFKRIEEKMAEQKKRIAESTAHYVKP